MDFNVLATAQGHLRSIKSQSTGTEEESLQGHKIRNLRSAAHCFMMEQNTLISLLYTAMQSLREKHAILYTFHDVKKYNN